MSCCVDFFGITRNHDIREASDTRNLKNQKTSDLWRLRALFMNPSCFDLLTPELDDWLEKQNHQLLISMCKSPRVIIFLFRQSSRIADVLECGLKISRGLDLISCRTPCGEMSEEGETSGGKSNLLHVIPNFDYVRLEETSRRIQFFCVFQAQKQETGFIFLSSVQILTLLLAISTSRPPYVPVHPPSLL